MKKLFYFFYLVPLISCSDHQTNNSWGSYATNKETKNKNFGLHPIRQEKNA